MKDSNKMPDLTKTNKANNDSNEIMTFLRFVLTRYFIAFVLIIIMAWATNYYTKHYNQRYEVLFSVIQHTTDTLIQVQRIALLARELASSEQRLSQQEVRTTLRDAITLLTTDHSMILEDEKILPMLSASKEDQDTIRDYIALARKSAQLPSNELNSKHPTLVMLLNLEEKTLSPNLYRRIQILNQQANRTMASVQTKSILIYVIALAFCIIFFLIVFLPTIRKTQIAYKERSQANEAKSNFLTAINHEIRTPLNAIIGNAELVLSSDLDSSQKQHAHTILYSAETLLGIINDVLNLSRIESGQLTLDNYSFNFTHTLKSILHILSIQAQDKNIELALYYAPDVPDAIIGDEKRLRQLCFNLIDNAIKFTKEGHVLINVTGYTQVDNPSTTPPPLSHNWINVSVCDSGIGIPENKQSNIFEKFTQADTSYNRKFGGTGIGLAICRKLAQLMGGDISVKSVENNGSTFSFTVPLRPESETAVPGQDVSLLKTSSIYFLTTENDKTIPAFHNMNQLSLPIISFTTAESILATVSAEKVVNPILVISTKITNDELDILAKGLADMDDAYSPPVIMLLDSNLKDYLSSPTLITCYGVIEPDHSPSMVLSILASALRQWQNKNVPAISLYHIENNGVQQNTLPHDDKPLKGYTILQAEDNRINSAMIEEMLLSAGAHVVNAMDGKEAINVMRHNESVDLILMDCQMPEMDGFDATRAIKKLPHIIGRELPILALTANTTSEDRDKCIASGMDDFISKPVHRHDLLAALNKWLPKHPAPVVKNETLHNNSALNNKTPNSEELSPYHFPSNDFDGMPEDKTNDLVSNTEYLADETKEEINKAEKSTASNEGIIDYSVQSTSAEDTESVLDNTEKTTIQTGVLDQELFSFAQETLGDRFPLMVSIFIEDTQMHLDAVYAGIEAKDPAPIKLAAHTIKSSAKQMGASTLSDIAKVIEFLAKDIIEEKSDQDSFDTIHTEYKSMQKSFAEVQQALQPFLQAA